MARYRHKLEDQLEDRQCTRPAAVWHAPAGSGKALFREGFLLFFLFSLNGFVGRRNTGGREVGEPPFPVTTSRIPERLEP
jgi:hypothetical protein